MIPQAFIQDLLARVDIVEVIERYLPLKKGGANYFACCPFHGEKSPSFSVSPSKQFYHCFGCGAHGSALGFLMEYSGLSFVEAIKELAAQVGMQVPDDGKFTARADDGRDQLLDAMSAAARFYRDQLKHSQNAIDYLKRRGVSGEVAARFGIGYAPDAWQSLDKVFTEYRAKHLLDAGLVIDNDQGRRYDRFRDRIMFPILDRRGRVIAFGGRILEQGEPKYLNSPETPLFEKGRELYGLFQAQKAIRDAGFALVVEGYMDVVALAQFGVGNAVAALGTATTPHHINTLLRQTDRVVFCFDGDAAGRKAAWRALENALEALRDDATLAFLFLPEEHDPDSFVRAEGADAFLHAARNATPLAAFLIQNLRTQCDMDSAEGRARFVHEARPLVSRIAAPLLRLQLLKMVAEESALTQHEVEQAFGLQAPTQRSQSRPGGESRTPRAAPRGNARFGSARFGGTRRPPSLVDALLRLVLHHPHRAARLPVGLIPGDSAESRALVAIIDAIEVGDLNPSCGLGALVERFRESEHGDTLARVASELMEEEFDDASVETLFEDTLRKLQADAVAAEIARLTALAAEGGLDATGRHRLAELLLEKRNLSPAGKV
ncbi:DNA primase [Pseudothauera nasutitermitis]|uniref:DNA primase n=1 Tax=Pseudothauera nasutitermitis TaxID=2565930 RepID=A0A4S4AQF0_9RHOO|nr:DNA primase [Pseudothauera nasutitermitis]THF61913.1 DNA primase [Pseudothauera nasutitermitis]